MPEEAPPSLSEEHIRYVSMTPNYRREVKNYLDDGITNLVRQGSELWAEYKWKTCGNSYSCQIHVTLGGGDGIENSSCTCSYSQETREEELCVHRIAVLYRYIRNPLGFHVIPSLAEMLASHSRDELFALIGQMVQNQPKLLLSVELANAQLRSPQPIDTSAYRLQAQSALRHSDIQKIVKDLQVLLKEAQQLAQAEDWLQAGILYQILLEESTSAYDDKLCALDLKHGEQLNILSLNFAQALGQCFGTAYKLEPQLRQLWLTTLVEATLRKVELCGLDRIPNEFEGAIAFTDYTTESESKWIEQCILAAIRHSQGRKQSNLTTFRTVYRGSIGRDQDGSISYTWVTPEKSAFLLLKEGKLDEATELAQTHLTKLPRVMLQFADSLAAAQAHKQASHLISKAARTKPAWGYQAWLIQYHREHDDSKTAFEEQQRMFRASPCLEGYEALRDVAQQAGSWQRIRTRVLASLERSQHFGLLIEIALHEKNLEQALELLPKLTARSQPYHQISVVSPIERTQHQGAIALHKRIVEELISRRKRDKYKFAVKHLEQIKERYGLLQAQLEWETYLQQLRSQYPNLRALQEELNEAKL